MFRPSGTGVVDAEDAREEEEAREGEGNDERPDCSAIHCFNSSNPPHANVDKFSLSATLICGLSENRTRASAMRMRRNTTLL